MKKKLKNTQYGYLAMSVYRSYKNLWKTQDWTENSVDF